MVGNAEGASIEAASGAEVVTEGPSEVAEEVTGEDMVLARWMQGQNPIFILGIKIQCGLKKVFFYIHEESNIQTFSSERGGLAVT